MGYQIIRDRTHNRYALFSSMTDTFVMRDATQNEIIDFFMEEYEASLRGKITQIVQSLNKGGKPYHQFTMTLEEAEEKHREHSEPVDARIVRPCGACGAWLEVCQRKKCCRFCGHP